jgi:hypothetical protein
MQFKRFLIHGLIWFMLFVGNGMVCVSQASGQEQSYEDINKPANARRPVVIHDVEIGRKHWLGKTLWCGERLLLGLSPNADELAIKKYIPLKVIDIRPSINWFYTIELIVRTPNGKLGGIYTYFTASHLTNLPAKAFSAIPDRVFHKEFPSLFLTKDPHLTYMWAKETWEAIENSRVLIGMDKQQVRFSWGEPKDVNTTETKNVVAEQWVYESRKSYVYFRNGKVDAIQNQ